MIFQLFSFSNFVIIDLGDANWNVRNALKKWREDDIWEKMHRVAKECSLSEEEAMQKLVGMNYDDTAVIKQWQKENKKETKLMAKITSKLGRNSKKEMTDPQGIEMNIQATPKGSEEQTQEETKGDDESEMNEGQTPMSSNATDGNEKETVSLFSLYDILCFELFITWYNIHICFMMCVE